MKNLLLERDFLIVDPWDALRTGTTADSIHSAQGLVTFRKTAMHGVTFRVFGKLGKGDLTGADVIEDMRVEIGGQDIYNELPESLLMDLERDVIEENE